MRDSGKPPNRWDFDRRVRAAKWPRHASPSRGRSRLHQVGPAIPADRDRVRALIVGAIDQHAAHAHLAQFAKGNLLRALAHHRDQSTSAARFIAGLLRFFTLIQCLHGPPRYGRSRCFDTRPSRPIWHAARNRSGPISPCSKGVPKMPSGWRASSRARRGCDEHQRRPSDAVRHTCRLQPMLKGAGAISRGRQGPLLFQRSGAVPRWTRSLQRRRAGARSLRRCPLFCHLPEGEQVTANRMRLHCHSAPKL
jgi:hypothetical protein